MSTVSARNDFSVDAVCQRFAEATGWPLRFAPAGTADADRLDHGDLDDCWRRELHDGTQKLGCLWIEPPEHPWQDSGYSSVCQLAELTGDLLSRYLGSSRLLDSRSRELSTFVEISRTVPSFGNVREAIGRLFQAALKLTGFRSVAFFLLNPETGELRLRAQEHLEARSIPRELRKVDRSPPDLMAFRHGKALLRTDVAASASAWLPPDAQMGCCLRVQSHEGPLGTLWVYDRRTRTPSEREIHVLESIAAQMVVVLERSVLLHESAAQQRLQRELKVASENTSMGVQNEPLRDNRLDVAMMCTSHYEVGGDLCEIISLDARRTLFAVGDAAGDSIPAALVISAVRGALRAETVERQDVDTRRLMKRLNRALHSITPAHQFSSMIVGVLDTDRRELRYTNAGHPVPVILHQGELQMAHSHGMLLGVSDEVDYEHSVVPMGPGDLLILYSDGVSEARNLSRRMFRSDGILDAVRPCLNDTADAILGAVVAGLETHIHGSQSADDRTLLVIRWKPD